MRYDTQPARLTAVVGSVHADGAGDTIWARRTKQTDGLFDSSPLITYGLNADGVGVWSSAPGHVNVDVDTTTFSSSGVDIFNSTSYEIYFGALLAPQSGTGVFLNPQGVLNAASFAPPGYPISPGGVMTLFGTGFPATAVTASAPPFGSTLGGVQVSVNGTAAPVYSVSSTQISAIVPFGVTGSTATIVVTVNKDEIEFCGRTAGSDFTGDFQFSCERDQQCGRAPCGLFASQCDEAGDAGRNYFNVSDGAGSDQAGSGGWSGGTRQGSLRVDHGGARDLCGGRAGSGESDLLCGTRADAGRLVSGEFHDSQCRSGERGRGRPDQ